MKEKKYEFDIQPYLNKLNGSANKIKTLADIDKVHSSKEYSNFINDLCCFYHNNGGNLKSIKKQENRNTLKSVIDSFWRELLGMDLIDKYITLLHGH